MKNKSHRPKIVAASVVGYLHLNKNIPCQDYYRYVVGDNLVAVVSDGAGSAKYGKTGAKALCTVLCDLLKNADFVLEYKEKNFIWYEINTSVFDEIIMWMQQFGGNVNEK